MTLSERTIKDIVCRVLMSEDYRIVIQNQLNIEFLNFAIEFFKKVVTAKMNSEKVTIDWYKEAFLDDALTSNEIAMYSGLNMKTINNMYKTSAKHVVIDAALEHFDSLYDTIQTLVEQEDDVDMTLTIKFKGVSVDLSISESLIVINTLAVRRAAMRGGAWSAAGKGTEKYLMLALCKLYRVEEKYYNAEHFVRDRSKDVDREIDFFLMQNGKQYKCEVKLMGKGNPESADAIIARGSNLFVADTLSEQNKRQCEQLGVCWVACREENGYSRFKLALEKFNIPYTDYNGNLKDDLPQILDSLF